MEKDIELEKNAVKFDNGKPQWQLMPPYGFNAIIEILTYGMKKYAPRNWEKGDLDFAERLIGASYRHLNSHLQGVKFDEESGLRHLAHAACSLTMALDLIIRNEQKVLKK